MNRFFVSDENLRGKRAVFGQQHAHQIRQVLRLKRGDRVIVLDNKGYEYKVRLTTVGRNEVAGQITEKRQALGEPEVQITLHQSLLARDKFEWVLQKCTEVGVTRFVPVITERSIVRDADRLKENKLARWQRIIAEAAEQSGRGRIPELLPAVSLREALNSVTDFDCCLMASPQEQEVTLRSYLRAVEGTRPSAIALFVGPEGGFTDEELQLGKTHGATGVGLGPRILRTETAAVVATALILYELGQMEA